MGWFGTKFQNALHTTHVHSPHPSEILHLYHLPSIIPLYPPFLSSIAIKYLVLHTLSLSFSRHMTDVFLSTIFSPPLHPPLIYQSISSCFTLQTSPTQHTWSTTYQKDPDTNFSPNIYVIVHLFPSLILNDWLLLIVNLLLTIYFVLLIIDLSILYMLLFLLIISVVSLFQFLSDA